MKGDHKDKTERRPWAAWQNSKNTPKSSGECRKRTCEVTAELSFLYDHGMGLTSFRSHTCPASGCSVKSDSFESS